MAGGLHIRIIDGVCDGLVWLSSPLLGGTFIAEDLR